MAVGGSALHWGGVTNRFSEEDLTLKSRYGLAADWPLAWTDLERHYCEAERRLGVSGEPGPLPEDKRSEPYPMDPMPLSYNLAVLKAWAEKSGIPFQGTPQAKNTRPYGGRAAVPALQHLRDLPDRRALLAGFHLQAAARREARHAARSDARPASRGERRRQADRVGEGGVSRQRRRNGISREDLRARVGLRVVAAPVAPVRRREQLGPGRPVHDRPCLHRRADRARRDALSRHERAAQPDLAAVLPLRAGRAVCPARSAGVGKLRRPGSAAERRGGEAAAGRRADGRLARQDGPWSGARPRLLRRASVRRQRA